MPTQHARLRCEPLEDRLTPASPPFNPDAAVVVSSIQPPPGTPAADTAVAVTSADPAVVLPPGRVTQLTPFAGYKGVVFVAGGDVSADGVTDVVASAALNGHVKVFDGQTGALVQSFIAYPGYAGAVRVAAGDVTGDGFADVITAAEVNGHVKAFDGRTGAEVSSFLTAPGFAGPADVAVTRFLGGSVTAAAPVVVVGARGQVGAFDARTGAAVTFGGGGGSVSRFAPYPGYGGPVYVAVADVNGDGVGDLITGAANGHLKAFSGSNAGTLVSILDPRAPSTGPVIVDVAAADADGATVNGRPTFEIVAGEAGTYSTYRDQTGTRVPTTYNIDRLNGNFVYVG